MVGGDNISIRFDDPSILDWKNTLSLSPVTVGEPRRLNKPTGADDPQALLETISKFMHAMVTLKTTNQMASGLFSNPLATMGQFALLAPFVTNLIGGGHANCAIPVQRQVPPAAYAPNNQSRVEQLNQLRATEAFILSEAQQVLRSSGLKTVKDSDSASSSKKGKKADFEPRIRDLEGQKDSAQSSVVEALRRSNQRDILEAKRELAKTEMKLKVFREAKERAAVQNANREEIFAQAERAVDVIDSNMDQLYKAQDAKKSLFSDAQRNNDIDEAATTAENAITESLKENGFEEVNISEELREAKSAKTKEKDLAIRKAKIVARASGFTGLAAGAAGFTGLTSATVMTGGGGLAVAALIGSLVNIRRRSV